MPYLRVRYRHEVKCSHPECGEFIVSEGQTSQALYADGGFVKIESSAEGDLRSAFTLDCPAGHAVDLYAPRDLQLLRSQSGAEPDFRPIVLRTGLA